MNSQIEDRFIKTFIRKSRRERLRHELTTPGKRYDGISRFCHQAKDLLEPARIIMEGDDIDRREEFTRFVRQHDEICSVISLVDDMNGRSLPLEEAVSMAIMCPDAVLILGSTFAIVFGEPMKGGRDKFLLSEDNS